MVNAPRNEAAQRLKTLDCHGMVVAGNPQPRNDDKYRKLNSKVLIKRVETKTVSTNSKVCGLLVTKGNQLLG